MDSPLDRYHRKYIKKMMLKQEQTFKSQVRDLHQLYKVQKTLMDKFGSEANRSSNLRNRFQFKSKQNFTQEYNQSSSTGTRKLCVSSCKESGTQTDSNNAEQPATEREYDEHDVELTLSIGGYASKRKSKNWLHDGNEFGEQCNEPSSNSNREGVADPPWLC